MTRVPVQLYKLNGSIRHCSKHEHQKALIMIEDINEILTCSYQSPHSIMSTLWANQSCDPFTGRDAQCVIGTYVQYAVNVSDVDQIAKTVNFAVEKNIRLVIKNTGHEYVSF